MLFNYLSTPPTKITLAHWCDMQEALIRSRPLKPRTISDRANNLRHLKGALGERLLYDVMPRDLELLINSITKSGRPFAARRVYIEAEELFNAAVFSRLIPFNPLSPVRKPSPRPSRSRMNLQHFLKIREAACSMSRPWFVYCLDLALVTSQRRADIASMSCSQAHSQHLHIIQQKNGTRIAIPLELRLDAVGKTVGDVVSQCLELAPYSHTLVSKRNGGSYSPAVLTHTFAICRDNAFPQGTWKHPPTFHEIRSLSERLYRLQGVDTQTLLGHKHPRMTDLYNDERDLEDGGFKYVSLTRHN